MNPIKPGMWRVQLVEVNSKPAGETEDFGLLISTPEALRLDPAGIVFRFQQATERTAVLESRSQVFFAEFHTRGDRLTINMSRPAFAEKITIVAAWEAEIMEPSVVKSA